MKYTTLSHLLTDREIRQAIKLEHARDICEKIIKPNIERIDRDTGQKNDPMYLAYLVEYAILQSKKNS